MLAQDVGELLLRLHEAVGQREVFLRCECENLETVYVHAGENGVVRVTDDHRTFQYLSVGRDSTYVQLENLDFTVARRLCEELHVELRDAPPNGYASIESLVQPTEPIADAVERVAQAVDRVFQLSMRGDLK